ncbi:MAG: class I SAM-dependent methyltransferase [Gammaproteobacteria bacterium]|nr:class I SAM-dependent methyltransferase [Gammaproteobacteria bacterium]
MNTEAILKAYRRYAQVYDFYFGALFDPGRRAVVEKMNCRPGDHVLEVGVGTGLSLPLYPHNVKVTGIDLSPEMLERARDRKIRNGLKNIVALEVMDAEQMRFSDNTFDKVVAMYVASVVPHPARFVDEMRRVCKPGGEIFILNHFQHANPIINKVERLAAPLSRLLGFRPDFSLPEFIQETGLDVVERMPVNIFGYWTLVHARNNKFTRKVA